MERSRLINKWMSESNMQIQTESIKKTFRSMLDCLSDIELMRPFIIRDRLAKSSLNEIAIRYGVSKDLVRHQIKCGEKHHTKSANMTLEK